VEFIRFSGITVAWSRLVEALLVEALLVEALLVEALLFEALRRVVCVYMTGLDY
jgi:hypothetical protein